MEVIVPPKTPEHHFSALVIEKRGRLHVRPENIVAGFDFWTSVFQSLRLSPESNSATPMTFYEITIT